MALTKCSECGKEVSEAAAICPHCGVANPSGKTRRDIERRDEERRGEERAVIVKRGGGFARFLLWVILIIFVVVFGAWYFGLLRFN